MLKVWRGKGAFLVECDACGSRGTAHNLQLMQKVSPEIEDAIERHTAHMAALRVSYTTATGKIAKQIQQGSLKRKDGADKIRELWANHVAQVRLGEASLPDPTGKVKDVVTECPWCKKPAGEVEIESLPEGATEPESWLKRNAA
jgi:hypothetical protein